MEKTRSFSPILSDGVWIGFLSDIGFVVYDKDIENLYRDNHHDQSKEIALWIAKEKRWEHFNYVGAKEALKKNIGAVTDADRSRIAHEYWIYRCHGIGSTKKEFERMLSKRKNKEKEEAEKERLKQSRDREMKLKFDVIYWPGDDEKLNTIPGFDLP